MGSCPIQTLLARFVNGKKGPFRGPFRVSRSVIVIELEVQKIDTSVIDFLESRSLSEIILLKMICQICDDTQLKPCWSVILNFSSFYSFRLHIIVFNS